MRSWIAGILFLFMSAIAIRADQIILKNGDRLTGSITKSDGKTLVIKTDYAGDVTVKFDAIQDMFSAGELHVELDGKTAQGPISTKGDDVIVATKTAGTVEAPRSSITTVRNQAEQSAYEKALHPRWGEGWSGGINLGFAVTRGNSETKNLNVAFTAVRKGFQDKLGLYANSIFATNDLPGATPHTTANSIGGGTRYDRDIHHRLFGFVNADFFYDELQSLDLRSIIGGGLGWHAVKRETSTLDLLSGANYTHESYSQPFHPEISDAKTRSLAAATLGDEFMQKIGAGTVIRQSLYFYPDLSNTGEYRGTFNFGTVTRINKWLGWQNSFGDVYVSAPPEGKKKNDLMLSTGLSFSFTR